MHKPDLDNHSRQLDQENDAYWKSRGLPGRPADPATPPVNPQPTATPTPAAKPSPGK